MVQPHPASYKRVTSRCAALSAASSAQIPKGHGFANTTPFPNLLLDEIMPLLKDTEWRLLCVIVRQTRGWYDAASGSRKASDWMTRQQLLRRTGRNSEALSKALDSLIRQNMVQAKDKGGHELATATQRRQARGPIFYALHPSLLGAQALPEQNAKTEHQELVASSAFGRQALESEHGEARKANGTKENTKQTGQKPAVPEGPTSERPAPREPGRTNTDVLPSWDERGSDESPSNAERDAMSEPAREVLIAYEQGFKGLYPQSEPVPLQSGIAGKLERCCETYGSQTLLLLLPAFFGSDRPVFVRHCHSLEAFLSSVNLLLYGSKELVRTTGKLARARFSNTDRTPQVAAAETLLSDALFDWNDLSQLALLRPDGRRFVALYLKRYHERFPDKTPPLPYLSALRRLDSLLQRHSEGELARLLDAYFACDWVHVKAQGYSLEAFAHNAELLE